MIIECFNIANVVVVTMKQMTLLPKADGIAIRSRWHCQQKQMALYLDLQQIAMIIFIKENMHFT